MPKAQKYYAVRIGRQSRKIHESWDECKANVSRFPGAIHKSFTSKQDAQAWLDSAPTVTSSVIMNGSMPAPSQPQLQRRAQASTSKKGPGISANMDPSNLSAGANEVLSLSKEQRQVLQRVRKGENVFFTGSAGTGKSVLLRSIISALDHLRRGGLAITASTGIAAVNIGGTTLHSWAGVGLANEKIENLYWKARNQETVRKRWLETQALIIDEISMIDYVFFDKLCELGQRLRNNSEPFGGIQLILSGDFFQLPPVSSSQSAPFVFEAKCWKACSGRPIFLTKVFRQKDRVFSDMLNAIRLGNITDHIERQFKALSRRVVYTDNIEPSELYPTRSEVERANQSRLLQLADPAYTFFANDRGGVDSKGRHVKTEDARKLLDRLIAPGAIELRVGAQVMLIKNMQQRNLVNGSLGKVIGFSTSVEALKENREISAMGEPKEGQPVLPNVPTDRLYPVVEFENGRTLLCLPHEFTIDNANGQMEARRDQIPLILAWALSVHKSQGQTLERVRVDLRRTFEKGQAYVALSRATKLETLEVLNFQAHKIAAHPKAIAWMRSQHNTAFEDPSDEEMEDDMLAIYD